MNEVDLSHYEDKAKLTLIEATLSSPTPESQDFDILEPMRTLLLQNCHWITDNQENSQSPWLLEVISMYINTNVFAYMKPYTLYICTDMWTVCICMNVYYVGFDFVSDNHS